MTDLIPRDAAIAAAKSLFRLQTTGLYGAAGVPQYGLLTETAEAAIRAIPTIDPAAIREAALREAAYVAINACLVPPDGGNPTEVERLVCEEAYRRILALIGEKK